MVWKLYSTKLGKLANYPLANQQISIPILSWNIEGFSRHRYSLRHFMEIHRPLLVLLTEPMVHSSDLPPLLQPFNGNYESFLNSEDFHEPDLSHGGTVIMWHSSMTPFVSVLPTSSPGFLTIVLKLPSAVPSLHSVIYLPTSGNDQEFSSMQ